jgi:hypothetical protein
VATINFAMKVEEVWCIWWRVLWVCRHGTNVRRATDVESITQRRFSLSLYNIASIVYRVSREERDEVSKRKRAEYVGSHAPTLVRQGSRLPTHPKKKKFSFHLVSFRHHSHRSNINQTNVQSTKQPTCLSCCETVLLLLLLERS